MTPVEASKKKNEGTVHLSLYGDMEPLSFFSCWRIPIINGSKFCVSPV